MKYSCWASSSFVAKPYWLSTISFGDGTPAIGAAGAFLAIGWTAFVQAETLSTASFWLCSMRPRTCSWYVLESSR